MTGERIARLREALSNKSQQAFFSVSPPTNQYLAGLEASFGEISSAILITSDEAHFLCDFRFTEQAKEEVNGYDIAEIKGDLLARAGEQLTKMGVSSAVFDPSDLTVDEKSRIDAAFKGELVPDKTMAADLRVVKTNEEIDTLRAASNLAEGAMLDLLPRLEEGIPEREFAALLEFEFKKRGATATSFDTIALFGPNSSLPHGIPGEKKLAKGDVVLLDFGCRKAGYCSDLTRTFAFGNIPGAWFEEIYALTYQAQHKALDAVQPGATGREVDAVARDIISEGGYGDYFGHGLGHGVGVEIHEAPRLNNQSDTVLKPGMIVTVEPGIYLPGKGGVRIEDLVVVTDNGCDILTTSSKELRVLDA